MIVANIYYEIKIGIFQVLCRPSWYYLVNIDLTEWIFYLYCKNDSSVATQLYTVRNADPSEFDEIGKLMVNVYSRLDGFPKESEQPDYYRVLSNVGSFSDKPGTELLVVVSTENKIMGALVYFADMIYYGSGGTAPNEKNASGFRLLAVHPDARGQGIGRLLANECVRKAREKKHQQLIIHTTMTMQTAWHMYENMGFKRSADLDFRQGELPVFGFRLRFE